MALGNDGATGVVFDGLLQQDVTTGAADVGGVVDVTAFYNHGVRGGDREMKRGGDIRRKPGADVRRPKDTEGFGHLGDAFALSDAGGPTDVGIYDIGAAFHEEVTELETIGIGFTHTHRSV